MDSGEMARYSVKRNDDGDKTMVLEYVDRIQTVKDSDLLEDLVKVSKAIGHAKVTIAEYDAHGNYNSSTITRHFKTWNKALEAAGLQISNRQYTIQELYDNLAEIWLQLGRQPTRRDLSRIKSPISYKAYERKFGKWSKALKSFVDFYNSNDESIPINISSVSSNSKHRTSHDVNLRQRFLVMKRDKFKCCICSASPAKDSSVVLHVDHIVPWANGGETVISNLQTLCSKCNLGKSNLPLHGE